MPHVFATCDELKHALAETHGVQAANLIFAVDFTKSNEEKGKYNFAGRCLHDLGDDRLLSLNPYQNTLSIIGSSIPRYEDQPYIFAYGFGDESTQDQAVFSFCQDNSPCANLDHLLQRYETLAARTKLSGPTSFAPAINQAVDIVRRSGGQFHVLVIVADGAVTTSEEATTQLTPQQHSTILAIQAASQYPLSIIVVGVGDGPWQNMRIFQDRLPNYGHRKFENFWFVDYNATMNAPHQWANKQQRAAFFAESVLRIVPEHYKAIKKLGYLHVPPNCVQLPLPPMVKDPPAAKPVDRMRSLERSRSSIMERTTSGGGSRKPARALVTQNSRKKIYTLPPPPWTKEEKEEKITVTGAPPDLYRAVPSPFTLYSHQQPVQPVVNILMPAAPAAPQPQPQTQPMFPAPYGYQQGPQMPQMVYAPAPAPNPMPGMPVMYAAAPVANPMPNMRPVSPIPDRFVCPLSRRVMSEPVMAADGFHYDRPFITDYLSRHNTSPKTGQALEHKSLVFDRQLYSEISSARQQGMLA